MPTNNSDNLRIKMLDELTRRRLIPGTHQRQATGKVERFVI